jgi:nucleoside-diphosphate-sugar epimerase
MIFVVGGNGLTGSAIVRYLEKTGKKYEIIQKENATSYIGRECDLLIFANGNAKKYIANEDPFFDFKASLETIAFYVHKIKYRLFIHLSTVDVYSDTKSLQQTAENININTDKLSNYGFHKYLAEEYIKKFSNKYLILRLPALVGCGLQKNPIYDYIHKHKKVFISRESILNVINTDFIAKIIFELIDKEIHNETFNLCSSKGIKISNLEEITGYKSEFDAECENYYQEYHININKIQQYCTLTTSKEAVQDYLNILKSEVQ